MDIKLRQIQEDDFIFARQLYELLMKPLTEELLPWKEDRQKDVIRKAVQNAQTRIILVDDEKAGWLQIDEANDHIYIGQIYINPDLQGKGIGTFLIQNIIQQGKADGKALKLSVMKNNLAKASYERHLSANTQSGMPPVLRLAISARHLNRSPSPVRFAHKATVNVIRNKVPRKTVKNESATYGKICSSDAGEAQPAGAADLGTSISGWKRDSHRTISSRAKAEFPTWQCCSAPSRAVNVRAVTDWAQTSSSMVR